MVCSHMLYISVCYKTLFTPTITITDRVDNITNILNICWTYIQFGMVTGVVTRVVTGVGERLQLNEWVVCDVVCVAEVLHNVCVCGGEMCTEVSLVLNIDGKLC